MTRVGCKRARGLAWLACVSVLGAVVGCSESGQGTVQVTTETREKLLPQAGGKGPAAGKTFSIKERGRSVPAAPQK